MNIIPSHQGGEQADYDGASMTRQGHERKTVQCWLKTRGQASYLVSVNASENEALGHTLMRHTSDEDLPCLTKP